ncbi:MAG: TRAP transporter small permease [Gammaproteobacteria bacterium]|nr:TRAP transporter small permease [Gammaproteobacteria bacterium]MBU2021150.1 TRAP transporter small permease [Gammaproteobacteria bacterium]MBU2237243.1 TRAP transporter small permease [Gammaproteobacteria bacterium]MBU2320293.1 TRAP transporter small permease [Gammaproteobacteria bacterium]MBU2414479.1 TRAP transporter small permease [Gammaproteobacteria bacterium]
MKYSLLSIIAFFCSKLSIAVLALMAIITFIDVCGRVILGSSLGFTYEIIGIFLAILFYAGLFKVHKNNQHIRIDLLDNLFKGTFGIVISWLSYFLEIALFSAIAVMLFQQMEDTRLFQERFMFLGFSKWYVLFAMGVLAIIALIPLITKIPKTQYDTLQDDALQTENKEGR